MSPLFTKTVAELGSCHYSAVMADNGEKVMAAAPGAAFAERHVEADGFRIRYLEAGQGPPLVHPHGAGGVLSEPRP
jgi:hypothetical protein